MIPLSFCNKKFGWLVFLCIVFSCGKQENKKRIQPLYATQVAIDSAMYNVGGIAQNSSRTISHTFKFTNRGDSVIHFTDVRTGCKCITYSLDKTTIAPKDSLLLTINYSYSKNKVGYFNKMIYVILNNGHLYSLIGLRGEIK